MRHRHLAWVPLLLLGAIGCSGQDGPTDVYELYGRVVEDVDGRPVEGASVTFVSDTLYRSSTSTDSDGDYGMTVETDVPFGQVQAAKDGYVPVEKTVYFDSARRRIDLRMRRGP